MLAALGAALALAMTIVAWVEFENTKKEQYEVYSAYITQELRDDSHDWGSGSNQLIVIENQSIRNGAFSNRLLWWPKSPHGLLKLSWNTKFSYFINNLFRHQIQPAFTLPSTVQTALAGPAELASCCEKEFVQKYRSSHGFVALSAVGFNSTRTQAVFYVDHFCGLCGGGRYVLMEKQNGVWQTVEEHYRWIS